MTLHFPALPALHQAIFRAIGCGVIISLTGLCGCKSGTSSSSNNGGGNIAEEENAISVQFRHRCAAPRSGIDPYTQTPYADTQGSLLEEKQWLASWSQEDYLWYRELPTLDLYAGQSAPMFFALLKTSVITPSGKAKDSYHYAVPSDEYHRFIQRGTSGQPSWVQEVNNGRILLAEPHTTTDGSSIARGAELLNLDGDTNRATLAARLITGQMDMDSLENLTLAQPLYEVREPGQSAIRVVALAKQATKGVQLVKRFTLSDGREFGYLSYREHNFSSETSLVDAINTLAGIDELALDLRNNGGGAVYIASVLASMLVDRQLIQGKWFERSIHNDKHSDEIYPFFTEAYGIRYPNGQLVDGALATGTPLPTLGLRRLFVLTSGATCSASESIINSLRGIDMEVIQIGATSCGKPYGFLPQDNCGYTYSTINFRGVNAKNEGDYTDGLDPRQLVDGKLAGCYVADTYRYALGDTQEPLLAAAINFSQQGRCPSQPSPVGFLPAGATPAPVTLLKPSWQTSKILGLGTSE